MGLRAGAAQGRGLSMAGDRDLGWWPRLRDWARRMKRDVLALWLAAQDARTPTLSKIVAAAVAAYALSPIDLIPDFVPVLGYLDDVVIVAGEWGRVEEIGGTFVVVRVWDERRLVVPLQWFIENPFQNWTRRTSALIGTVFLWVDYTTPLEPLRAEARRLCEASPDWDGRVCVLQVTEAGEHAMQLRVLVSSASSGQAWDLRCAVREGLVGFLQRTHPAALPRIRAQWDARGEPAPSPGA